MNGSIVRKAKLLILKRNKQIGSTFAAGTVLHMQNKKKCNFPTVTLTNLKFY